MNDERIVTAEEMSALFSPVPQEHLEAIRPRIFKRCTLIVLIFTIRAVAVTYYPEYLLLNLFHERLSDPDAVLNLTQVRLTIAFFCSIIYLYSFFKNFHFRLVNAAVLIVMCSLIWSDFESLLALHSFSDLTLPSLGFMAIRFVAVGLLVRNYQDLNR